MNESKVKGGIRVGTIVWDGTKDPTTIPEYIRQILPHGFESFSLFFWQNTRKVDWNRLASEVREVLDDTGAVISSIGLYGNPLEAGEDNAETRKCLEHCIDSAHLFGCDLLTSITGRVRGCPVPKSMSKLKEVWGPLAERAGDSGVRVAFETWDGGGTWMDGNLSVAHNPDAWSLIFEALPYENVGLELCPGTLLLQLMDPAVVVREWGAKLFHVHGKDATLRWDVLKRQGVRSLVNPNAAAKAGCHTPYPYGVFRTPGFGDTNWTDLISELRFAGYAGSIDIEGRNDPLFSDDLEMSGQVASLRYLQQCRGVEYVPNPTIS